MIGHEILKRIFQTHIINHRSSQAKDEGLILIITLRTFNELVASRKLVYGSYKA